MKPQMPELFTVEKLVPLMDQAGVDRVVVAEAGRHGRVTATITPSRRPGVIPIASR